MGWNHGLGEFVTAHLAAGLEHTALVEHTSVPVLAFPALLFHDRPPASADSPSGR